MPTALNPGDIAIVGFRSGSPDGLAFVTLKDLDAGTMLGFTDASYQQPNTPASWRGGENFAVWTASTSVPAGTVVVLSFPNSPATSTADTGTISGALSGISGSGDQVFIYQRADGTVAATSPFSAATATATWNAANGGSLLFGINVASPGGFITTGTTNLNSTNTSYVPDAGSGAGALTLGATALNITAAGIAANAQYNGPRTGLAGGDFLTQILDQNNWVAVDVATGTLNSSDLEIASSLPRVNLAVSSNAGAEAGQTVITVTATASSAVTGDQTVGLGVSGANITTGDYILSAPTITIASGQTSGSVTFTITDDTVFEGAETASLTLSNPSAGIALGATTVQAIAITDNDVAVNATPTIQENTATPFVNLAATGSGAVSGVLNDPTDPASTLGIDFAIADTDTPVGNLTVTVSSSNPAVVSNANLVLTGTGATRNLKINPSGVGLADLTVTVSDGNTSSVYTINYAASAGALTPTTTRFLTGVSDASTAVAIDSTYMFVADDENQVLRLYDRTNSGLPVAGFDFTTSLGLTDISGGAPREVDIEASAQSGSTIYWMGSHSNSSGGADRPNRERIFATTVSGTGAATTLTYAGRYDFLAADLFAWDAANGNALGLAASAAAGVVPELTNGFNIEGLTFAPNGTTAYVAFRAPNEPTTSRDRALIIPVTNFTTILSPTGGTAGSATFGAPIQLDLGGRGIREIKRSANGDYLIIAGPAGAATGTAPADFRLYTWTGNAVDAPVLRSADLTALLAGGSFESIVELPGTLTDSSQIQVLVDNGDTDFYNTATAAKDLAQNNFKKFRSEIVTLGTAVQTTATVTIAATDANAAEAGQDPGTFRITRTGSTSSDLTVNYAIASGAGQATGADYTPSLTGTATIPTGSSFVDITLTPVDDTAVEGSETVALTLASGAGYAIGASNAATVTIADNDGATPSGLAAGDVAFLSLIGDNPDTFSFVLLKDIAAGTVINVTDNGWLASGALRTGEGVLQYVAPTAQAIGTVITYVDGGTNTGWTNIGGGTTFALSTSGDSLIAFQGTLSGAGNTTTSTSPTLLGAVTINRSTFDADATNTNTTALPTGLTAGVNAVAVGQATIEFDNSRYTGPTTFASVAEARTAINTASNWTGSDTVTTNFTGTFTIGNAPPTPGLTITQSGGTTSVVEGGASDSYGVALNTQPTADVTITLANPGAIAQLALTPTTLTFTPANWNTPQSVTVTAVDDTLFEGLHTSTIATAIASSDTAYNGLSIAPLTVSIVDNDVTVTKIHAIQGSGNTFNTALGGTQTIEGVVVAAFNGSTRLNGFYVQEEDADADADAATSEGIFVFDPTGLFSGSVGSKVRITGTVGEFTTTSTGIAGSASSSLTQLSSLSSVINLGTVALPTVTNVVLPVVDASVLERYEGMLVNVSSALGPLTVTETFKLGRFGQVGLSGGDRIDQYTQVNAPSVSGYANYVANLLDNYIILDDGSGSQNPDPTIHARGGQPLSAANTLRGGDTIASISGVLDQRFEGYRVQTTTPANFQPTNPREATAPAVGGTLRVASLNLLNFFNGNGLDANNDGFIDGGFPTSRGADTAIEFKRQLDKTVQAVLGLNADVFGYNEMENDGYGSASAVQQLVDALNAATAPGTYSFVIPPASALNANGGFGGDEITVGFIYKTSAARVAPGTDPAALTTGIFAQETGSRVQRPALAVTFERLVNGTPTNETFTGVINHFKSKGSAANLAGDADQGDGQGLSNATRTAASQQLAAWLATNPTGTADPDYLIMGDLNAYRLEDPITTLTNAGYTSLFAPSSYSYQFNGQWGSLDHALASGSLASQVAGAAKWHINADEPIVLDYNTEFKTANQVNSFYSVDPFRTSDHDPIVVGLNLQSNNAAPVAVTDTVTTAEDAAVTFNVLTNDTDANGDTLTITSSTTTSNGSLVSNGNGSFTYTPAPNFNGSDSFAYTISDGKGGTATATVNLTVTPVNDPAVVAGTTTGIVTEDAIATTAIGTLTATDVDSAATFVAQANTDGTYGSFALGTNGAWTYSLDNNRVATNALAAGQTVTDVFTVATADGTTQTVTITVNGSNDAPVANGDSASTTDTQSITLNVLANDTDVDSAGLAIASFTNPASGSLVQNANNTFTYTPTLGFVGTTNFSYTVVDSGNLTATATVTVTVTPGSNLLIGTNGDDILVGTSRNDVIQALAGNDTLNGGVGADTLIGGTGNDTYIVDASDVIVENPGEGTDLVQSSISWTLATTPDVENLTLTGNAAINGTGNAFANVLTGNSAANTLTGGAGDDTYIVGAGDSVIEAVNEGTDLVQSSITWTLATTANVENLTLTGNAATTGTGNELANVITGNGAANTLNGGGGNDTLNGGGGNDTLNGGNGDDTLNGGTGNDRLVGGTGNDTYIVTADDDVVEAAGAGIDLVLSSDAWDLDSNVENLTLTGSGAVEGIGNTLDNVITGNTGNNFLSGGAGRDTLIGGAGNDTLTGGSGNDILTGGSGNDTLTGGSGNDRFVYNAFGDRNDTITDFNTTQDQLDLSVLLDSLGYLGSAPVAEGFLRFTQSGSNTLVQIDQNGATGGASFSTLATLNGVNSSNLVIGTNVLV